MGGESSGACWMHSDMAIAWAACLLLINVYQVFGLRCLQCIGNAATCRMSVRTCPSYETTCISLAYKEAQGFRSSDTLMKGCSTPELCNQTSAIDIGSRSIYMSATCCERDFCNINRFSTTPVFSNRLQCCRNTTCSDTMFCDGVNNWCVDVASKNVSGAITIETRYTKGCGSGDACNTTLAYNTGSFQHFTQYTCCNHRNNCNNIQQSIPTLDNNNGIRCWGCRDGGNNECAPSNQTYVQCKGIQIRCMEAFDQTRNKTVMKGCSTVSFCSSTPPHLDIPSISEVQCCAGSLCNNFTREYDVPVTVSSGHRTNTDSGVFIFLFSLLCASIRHLL
ncbi:urokinase plasminogen activator surface receptor-like [Spea bombifrons]|uniref:urokinase plasminogen activator surface receptor-like n=1 Tax=Spea bombifrons TaxID=233779 RepID=UPI00234970A5|nr:urokinase plasminogen activator surface receptor-like [Spea bombifrons]